MFRSLYTKYFRKTFAFKLAKFYYDYKFRKSWKNVKIVLITGVGKGLGRLLALSFFKDGYQVIGVDILTEDELDTDLKSALSRFYNFDLTNLDDTCEFVNLVLKENEKIDLVINNAGVLNFKLLHEYSINEINTMVTVNLTSVIVLVKCLLPIMIKRRFGRIINISSTSAFQAEDKFSIYSATKSAIVLFTESVAKLVENKLDGDITINSINPDRILTPEFLELNPSINPDTLIKSEKIYKKILKIVNSQVNGGVFPVFSAYNKLKYMINHFFRIYVQ